MKSPSKITCFSRPARGKGGGVEVCRQGHALWLGDHYDLDQFNHWKESKKKPMAVLAAKRSSRQTKKASKAGTGAASSSPGGDGAASSNPGGAGAASSSPGGAGAASSSPSASVPPSSPEKRILECSLEDSFHLVLSSDDMDVDEYVSLDEAVTMDDVSMTEEASLNEDITFDETFHFDGEVSLGGEADISEDDFEIDSSLHDEYLVLEEAVAISEGTTNDVVDDPQLEATGKSLIEKKAKNKNIHKFMNHD